MKGTILYKNSRKKIILMIAICIFVIISLLAIFITYIWQNQVPKLSQSSLIYKYFFVNLPKEWKQISYTYQEPINTEAVTFSRSLNNMVINISIKVSDEEFEEYHTSQKITLGRFPNSRYKEYECGGGKGLGSYCGSIIFPHNNKWYYIGYFDYYSRIGPTIDKVILFNFLTFFNPTENSSPTKKTVFSPQVIETTDGKKVISSYFNLILPHDWDMTTFTVEEDFSSNYHFFKRDYGRGFIFITISKKPRSLTSRDGIQEKIRVADTVGTRQIKKSNYVDGLTIEHITFNYNNYYYFIETNDRNDYLKTDLQKIISSVKLIPPITAPTLTVL